MFRGRFEHTIDSKGRISIPSKFREILREKYDERLMVTNFDGCLFAYPTDEWTVFEEKASKQSIFKKEVMSFVRFFFSSVTECNIDKLGRILIPQTLREYANLTKDVVVLGALNRIEFWSKERWNTVRTKSEEDITNESARNALADLGL